MKRWVRALIVLSMLAWTAYAAENPSFKRHVIQLPDVRLLTQVFPDLDGDGMTDLLAFSPSGQVFIFLQTPSGFPTTPDQEFKFPKGTVWCALADVSADPGKEIVISTGNGVAYYSQKDGVFATEPKTLIEAEQLFAGKTVNHVGFVGGYRASSKGKLEDGIPVIFPDHVVTYVSDDKHQYQPGARTDLEYKTRMRGSSWSGLSVGGEKSKLLTVSRRALYKSEKHETDGAAEDHTYIKRIVEEIKEKERYMHAVEEVDINKDGKEDVGFWYFAMDIDPTTTFMTFIRRADGSLPKRPDQVLRCRGLPGDWDISGSILSPFIDIDNDGYPDVVLLEMKDVSLSVRSLLQMLASEGMDWRIAVRLFDPEKGYSKRADYRKDITAILPILRQTGSMMNFAGDFNGDGRPDLMIRRSHTLLEIYLSSEKGELFSRKPGLRFEIPKKGWPIVHDYNGDNISDIRIDSASDIDTEDEEETITLFLSESSTGGTTAR